MSFLRGMAIGAVLSVMGVGLTHATVITDLSERDWLTTGDGALTYDASTSLEWLDLTVTQGNSILVTESLDLFGDFRWATLSEIHGLFDSAIAGTGYRTSTTQDAKNQTRALIDLLGTTDPSQGGFKSQGISRGSYTGIPGAYGRGYIYVDNDIAKVTNPERDCCASEDSRWSNVGSWLVRTVEVPEPSSLALLGLGLVGLGFARKKKAA